MVKYISIFILFLVLLSCNSTDKVNILRVNKSIYTGSQADPLAKSCLDWKLTVNQVKTIFKLSKKIKQGQLYQHFYQLPCEIEGEALLNGKPINFVVNAASYISIDTGDSYFYKGCDKDRCKHLFLMVPET